MGRKGIPAFFLALFLVTICSSSSLLGANKEAPPPEPDWALINPASWDEAVYKLVPPPTENGNAAAFFIGATHTAFDGDSKLAKQPGYEWWDKLDLSEEGLQKPETAEILAKAVKIPELDLIVKGSQQKDYKWVGIWVTPSADANVLFFTLPFPRYIDILRLCNILVERAFDKLGKGDKAGAESDILAAFRAGHLMQKDVTILGLMVGVSIEARAAKRMAEFYRKAGNEAKAAEWEKFQPTVEAHREAVKAAFKYIGSLKPMDTIKFADRKDLPRGIRMESLTLAISNDILSGSPVIMGVSGDIKKFIILNHFGDDAEMNILQLKIIEDVYVGGLSSFGKRMRLKRHAAVIQ